MGAKGAVGGAIAAIAVLLLIGAVAAGPGAAGAPTGNEFRDPPVYKSRDGRLDVTLHAVRTGARLRSALPNGNVGREVMLRSFANGFQPDVWQVEPGDTIHVDFFNDMPNCSGDPACEIEQNTTNLHTHGLVVSSRDNGDNMGIKIWPRGVTPTVVASGRGHDHDHMAAHDGAMSDMHTSGLGAPAPEAMPQHGGHAHAALYDAFGHFRYDIALPSVHPAGLNWFHSHIHGQTQAQIGGGMFGVIAVGNPPVRGLRTRFMALHDLQLVTDPATKHETPLLSQDLDFCKSQTLEKGVCLGESQDAAGSKDEAGKDETGKGEAGKDETGKKQSGRWLFAINDQVYPTITMKAGSSELWRIVNASANVTYRLALDNGSNLCVLTIDGLALRPEDDSESCDGATRSSLILLPAARAELVVEAPHTKPLEPVQLVTLGFRTGGPAVDKDGEPVSGDALPPIALAEVRVGTPTPAPPPKFTSPLPIVARAEVPGERCPGPATSADHRSGNIRYITLASSEGDVKTDFDFKIGAAIGPRRPPQSWVPPQPYAFGEAGAPDPLICAKFGHTEIWKVENHTGELHNFHVHQLKFRVIDVCPPDATGRCRRDLVESLDCSDRKPLALPGAASLGADGAAPSHPPVDFERFATQDTIPVPCASKANGEVVAAETAGAWKGQAKYPGYVLLEVPLQQREQIGSYVFHCHILEHQERGMMGRIIVQE